MPQVIAVCGTMGSGKSTLVGMAAAAMAGCDVLHEDDFNWATDRTLTDIEAWWTRGADVGEFDLSSLCREFAIRRAVGIPGHQGDVLAPPPTSILFLESQFGRLHPALVPWIDFQVWIDVPADVALARKVAQLSTQFQMAVSGSNGTSGPSDGMTLHSGDALRWITEFCSGYLSTTRKFFEMQRQKVPTVSDVVLDGRGTPVELLGRLFDCLPGWSRNAA